MSPSQTLTAVQQPSVLAPWNIAGQYCQTGLCPGIIRPILDFVSVRTIKGRSNLVDRRRIIRTANSSPLDHCADGPFQQQAPRHFCCVRFLITQEFIVPVRDAIPLIRVPIGHSGSFCTRRLDVFQTQKNSCLTNGGRGKITTCATRQSRGLGHNTPRVMCTASASVCCSRRPCLCV